MKFLRYANQDDWWLWKEDTMRVSNFHGGWHNIDENSPSFMNGTVIEASGWCGLYRLTGWCPIKLQKPDRDMWISPLGEMFGSEDPMDFSHESMAEDILLFIFDKEAEPFGEAGDFLIQRGWIKVTTSLMGQYYEDDLHMYDNMTDEQWVTYQLWKEKYQI